MRILFVTSNRVGDAILSTVVLRALLRKHRDARVTIACGPAAADVFRGVPGLDRIVSIAKKKNGAHWLELWLSTVTRTWDIVVDLRASALAWCLIAKERRIYSTPKSYLHRVESFGRFAGNMVGPKIWLTAEAEAKAARLLDADRSPIIAFGPTANWVGKQWPIERFIALSDRLTAPAAPLHGARVMVLGGPGERAAALPLLDHVPSERLIDLVGTVDLLTAAACLKHAALYVGNDSGLMHLAAAMDVPTLGLFGPRQEMHYAPFGPLTATIRGERYDELLAGAKADRAAEPPRSSCHMLGLTVDAVETAALALHERASAAQARPEPVPA